MSTNPIRLQQLFDRYINDACTSEELKEFWLLIDELSENDPVADDIKKLWRNRKSKRYSVNDVDWNKAYNQMLTKARAAEVDYNTLGRKKSSHRWLLVAASSVILLGACVAVYFLFNNQTSKNLVDVENVTTEINDVAAPAGNRALLTLSNGQTIVLDSVSNGTLTVQGKVKVLKNAAGEIVYDLENGTLRQESSQEAQYNTLYNPRGSKIAVLTLVDGSKVWLNSESSVKYFTSVGEGERKVEITGEAYFEVAKDKRRKFVIVAGDVTAEVLGTHFNVNRYEDARDIKITLLEGALKVEKGNEYSLLKPGQQASVSENIKVLNNVDTYAVMAWKNGLFQFQNADLQTVMQQLARWYDLEISYDGTIPARRFEGKIQRELNLSDVLDALAKNQVHYRIENLPDGKSGKRLIVTR